MSLIIRLIRHQDGSLKIVGTVSEKTRRLFLGEIAIVERRNENLPLDRN
jgi:hypothetical protein